MQQSIIDDDIMRVIQQSILDDDIMRVMQFIFRLYFTDFQEQVKKGLSEEINDSLNLNLTVDIYNDNFWNFTYKEWFSHLGQKVNHTKYLWDYFNRYYKINSTESYLNLVQDPTIWIFGEFDYIHKERNIMSYANLNYHSKYKELLKTWTYEEFSIIPK